MLSYITVALLTVIALALFRIHKKSRAFRNRTLRPYSEQLPLDEIFLASKAGFWLHYLVPQNRDIWMVTTLKGEKEAVFVNFPYMAMVTVGYRRGREKFEWFQKLYSIRRHGPMNWQWECRQKQGEIENQISATEWLEEAKKNTGLEKGKSRTVDARTV